MSNKERLQEWIDNEKTENKLVDIKFCPGEISKSSENTLCGAALIALKEYKLGNFTDVKEL
jgi:hypothetical protein